jgi:hypothetical protein
MSATNQPIFYIALNSALAIVERMSPKHSDYAFGESNPNDIKVGL